MSDTAIKFEHVSKLYELGVVGTGTLSHDIKRWWVTSVLKKEDPYLKIGETNDRASKGESQFVYALKDIDFEVKQGDVLGIIGKNGAGKSTLLKLLSRVTYPTAGSIYTKGRIASLLEVGTGFHPELTGRENIYMNGSILGMRKHEIDSKLDEIVDFSGCERYIDTPVKRYSSGMAVRLGFAIAAHLDPEILVVDEVLAVGDAEFQKKAIGKMQDVSKGEGRTVLFVSHNMQSIKRLCKSGIVLKHGQLDFAGTVKEAVEYYISNSHTNSNNLYYDDLATAPGNENIRLRELTVKPTVGDEITVESGIDITLRINNYRVNAMVDATFELRTVDDIIVFHQGTFLDDYKQSKEGEYEVHLQIPPKLINSGKYVMKIWFGENCRYMLWTGVEHSFTVSLTTDKDGFSVGERPGFLRTDLHFTSKFLS